jgi:hypothetical protein
MDDDPPQVVLAQYIVRPNNRSDGFRTASNTRHDVLSNIRIETFWSLGGIMQPNDRESHGDGKANSIVADRFLQHDKAAGVFLFIRHDTAKRDFTSEGIQGILRIEDGGLDAEDFKLLQIAAAGVAHADECRRS